MHRTNESRNDLNLQDWHYKPTELNVVDDCSRLNKMSTRNFWELSGKKSKLPPRSGS